MGPVSLALLVLKSRQLDRLRTFYGCLGIEWVEERHGKGPLHFSGKLGDSVLELYPLPEGAGPTDTTTRLGFAVADLPPIMSALETLGVTIITKPVQTPWGLRAVVEDPDRRQVDLYQR